MSSQIGIGLNTTNIILVLLLLSIVAVGVTLFFKRLTRRNQK